MFVHTSINLLGGSDLDMEHLEFLKSVVLDSDSGDVGGSDEGDG